MHSSFEVKVYCLPMIGKHCQLIQYSCTPGLTVLVAADTLTFAEIIILFTRLYKCWLALHRLMLQTTTISWMIDRVRNNSTPVHGAIIVDLDLFRDISDLKVEGRPISTGSILASDVPCIQLYFDLCDALWAKGVFT